MVSLVPFACICATAAVWPNIEDALTFFGYTVYNFNGYIVPLLMGVATYQHFEPDQKVKILLCKIGIGIFVFLGIFCLVNDIIGFFS